MTELRDISISTILDAVHRDDEDKYVIEDSS